MGDVEPLEGGNGQVGGDGLGSDGGDEEEGEEGEGEEEEEEHGDEGGGGRRARRCEDSGTTTNGRFPKEEIDLGGDGDAEDAGRGGEGSLCAHQPRFSESSRDQ